PGGDPGAIFRTLWWSGAAALLGDYPEEKKALLDPGERAIAQLLLGGFGPIRRGFRIAHALSPYSSVSLLPQYCGCEKWAVGGPSQHRMQAAIIRVRMVRWISPNDSMARRCHKMLC